MTDISKDIYDLVELGFHLFPLSANSKIPLKGTKGLHEASNDVASLENALAKDKNVNIAIRTGRESGVTILDIDKKSGGIESLASLEKEYGELACNNIVATANDGFHFYFSYNPALKTTTNLMPGLDIRNDGAYVVAPPSNINGKGYTWTKASDKFNTAPQFLINLAKKKNAPIASSSIDADIGQGMRNSHITKLCGALQRIGIGREAIYNAAMAENTSRLNPPLSEREVTRIVDSVARYTPTDIEINETNAEPVRASELITKMTDYLSDKDLVKGEPTGLLSLDDLLGGGKRLGEVTAWHAEAKTGKNTLWHYLMAKLMMREHPLPIGYASRELTPESEVLPNLISLITRQNAWLNELTEKRKLEYQGLVAPWPLFFTSGYGHISFEELAQWMIGLKETQGVEYFWIDHLHYCLVDPEEHKEASKFAKQLKTFAKQQNVHIDLIIQPNKLMEGQKLSLNSIKGGSAIGQAIDNLIILERVRQPGIVNVMRLTLSVGRSKLCKLGNLYLQYNSDTTDFLEVDLVETDARGY